MSFILGLKCLFCDTVHTTRVPYTCPCCGIGGILDVLFDYPAIGRVLTRRKLAAQDGSG